MSNRLKDQLVKLGSKRKDLRPHIRPVLAELDKTAADVDITQYLEPYVKDVGKVLVKEFPNRLRFAGSAARSGVVWAYFEGTFDPEEVNEPVDLRLVVQYSTNVRTDARLSFKIQYSDGGPWTDASDGGRIDPIHFNVDALAKKIPGQLTDVFDHLYDPRSGVMV